MQLSTKTKVNRSKYRQLLHAALAVWVQREVDMGVAYNLTPEDRSKKLEFIRQEQAKLRKKLSALDRGFKKQRAWSQGKLLY